MCESGCCQGRIFYYEIKASLESKRGKKIDLTMKKPVVIILLHR